MSVWKQKGPGWSLQVRRNQGEAGKQDPGNQKQGVRNPGLERRYLFCCVARWTL